VHLVQMYNLYINRGDLASNDCSVVSANNTQSQEDRMRRILALGHGFNKHCWCPAACYGLCLRGLL